MLPGELFNLHRTTGKIQISQEKFWPAAGRVALDAGRSPPPRRLSGKKRLREMARTLPPTGLLGDNHLIHVGEMGRPGRAAIPRTART